jgi:hypothetical protein
MTCDSESVGACQLSSLNGSTLSPISLPVKALGRVRVWSIEGSVCCLQSTLPTLGARGQAILFKPDGVPMVSLPEVQAHPIPFAESTSAIGDRALSGLTHFLLNGGGEVTAVDLGRSLWNQGGNSWVAFSVDSSQVFLQ